MMPTTGHASGLSVTADVVCHVSGERKGHTEVLIKASAL